MSENRDTIVFEKAFAQLLDRFDSDDKEEVGLDLIKRLGIERHGRPYQEQVAKVLQRTLLAEEVFKLDVLNKVMKFHSIDYSNGGGGGEEEEE